MLKFDRLDFLTIDRYGSFITCVTGAWQASSGWLKQRGI